MLFADLYIRVSTDEQADKGYSQRYQEEVLRKYCTNNNIMVRKTIFEDHSAKTFERPQWNLYLKELQKSNSGNGLLLFLKWDRFSRNAGDAYYMIALLKSLGIEARAIEQPLDLSIPENKMMLAFYLAAPEVENDRRALNIISGMRRAKKEGRWMGHAPVGYKNRSDEYGRKYIAIDEPQAKIIRWIFFQLEKGVFSTEQIYREAKENGFKGVKSHFWSVIRNPIYCGKIMVPATKGEEGYLLTGQHDPIISEELFESVQYVLDGRKKSPFRKTKISSPELIYLRGFIKCPLCGRSLTGSLSKGRTKYYSYYHCTSGCSFRVKTDKLHDAFIEALRTFNLNDDLLLSPCWQLLKTCYFNKTANVRKLRNMLFKDIKEAKEKITKARELFIQGKLEAEDYQELRELCEQRTKESERHLAAVPPPTVEIDDLEPHNVHSYFKLDKLMSSATVDLKRKLLGLLLKDRIEIHEGDQISVSIKDHYKIIFIKK